MDSPRSNANQQAPSSVSDKSQEETKSPSKDPSEETIPAEEPQSLDDNQIAIPEYGCKYCDKKFSNKQALGGHQNAHKIDRTIEKVAREMRETSRQYFGSGTSSTPILSSYHRSPGFMNRSFVSWPYPSQQHGIHIGYDSRPGLPMAGELYGPRSRPGFNNVYPGWTPPVPRIPQFPGQASCMMPNHGLNLPFFGESSSSLRPDRNPGGVNFSDPLSVLGDEDDDNSGLDLSLKL